MELTVGQVAALTGVTIRTLHHYDEIGLLVPHGRSASGYRLYDESDVERLQRILYYRELGFPLDQILELLADDRKGGDHLRRQHDLLTARITRLTAMRSALEREMEASTMGYRLSPEERLEVWGTFRPEDYEDEARERWGSSDAYAESARRTKEYTAEQWRAIKAEQEALSARFVELLHAGASADSTDAMDVAEDHRLSISRWFYPCSIDMHAGLADMYLADPRFTKTFEDIAPGLAQFTADAMHANAIRQA